MSKLNNIFKIFLIILILFLSIASLSANDLGNNELIEIKTLDDDQKTFTDLNDEINGNSSSFITLHDDFYLQDDEYDIFKNGINISKNEFTINGNGHTIYASSPDGSNSRIFNITGYNVLIYNITFVGGYGTAGGAIYNTGDKLELKDNIFKDNGASYFGGAIYNEGNNFTLTGVNQFFNNVVSLYGGAIFNKGDNFLIDGNNLFNGNYADYSGGAIANNGTNFKVKGSNIFKNNSADSNGGAIINNGTNSIITGNNEFLDNSAGYGGAILSLAGNFKINGSNIFKNNTALFYAGAFYNHLAANVTISGSNEFIENNVLTEDPFKGGGAIFNEKGENFLINGSNTFKNNNANTSSGGAIFNKEGNNFSIIGKNTFKGNIANYGGAISLDYSKYFILEGENTFLNNIAIDLDDREGYGGGIYLYFTDFGNLSGASFINNSAYGGAGIFIDESNVQILDNMNFLNNSAYYAAGIGIYLSENITILNNYFKNNIAELKGSDIVNENGSIFLKNNTGPIFVKIASTGEITSQTFFKLLNGGILNAPFNTTILLYASLTDDKNNFITNQTITFKFANETLITNNTLDSGLYYYYYDVNLEPGNYTVTGSVDLLENVSIRNGTLNIISMNLISGNLTLFYKNGSQYIVRLVDYEGNPIYNESVLIRINKIVYERITDINGYAYLNINLNPSNYTVISYIDYVVNTNNVEVKPTIVAQDLNKTYKNESQFNALILDGKGDPLINYTVSFNINGVIYYRNSDKNGIATLNINLSPGKYIVTVNRNDTGLNMSYNIEVLSNIISSDLTKYYRNGSQFTALMVDNIGNPFKNTEVKMNINGIMYYRNTTDEGIVTLNINLNPDEYIITIYHPENQYAQSNLIKVLAILVNSTFDDNKFSITALDDMGKIAINKTVSFNINGVISSSVTDNNGVAILNVNLNPASYIITSSYNEYSTSEKIDVL
ncbi:beta strand repeat-containing protein [Methanobrevibacter sp. DSM 116169]|uniref:beta strand repeat-containing protein n=1 Tax=Methanobrevibacter sp. DSM 116169 TaxID=3242727 RepID=UPI0038FCF049